MTDALVLERFKTIAEYFPLSIRNMLLKIPEDNVKDITEIRVRSGKPVSVNLHGNDVFLSDDGMPCFLYQKCFKNVTDDEIYSLFLKMCDYSVYTKENELKNGFISLIYGCRAGIAGRGVYENGSLKGYTDITSVCIRIACEHKGTAISIVSALNGSVIIAGPPGCGKTTLLRDSIRLVSCGIGTAKRRTAVIDTRDEISGNGYCDLGQFCDVLSGVEKKAGIETAIRTLNPQVIAFDEIGSEEEAGSVLDCFNAGVNVFTTVHAGSVLDTLIRPCSRMIIESGAIKSVVFLKNIFSQPEVFEVVKLKEKTELVPAEENYGA